MGYSPRVAKSRTRLSDFTFTLSNKDLLYCTGNSTQYPVKTNGKDSDAGRDWRQEEKGTTQDEMAGWHHGLDGRESE